MAMDSPAAAAPSLAPPSRQASRKPPRRRTATEEDIGDDAPWLRVTCKMARGGGLFFLCFSFSIKQNFRSRPFTCAAVLVLYMYRHSYAYLLLRLRLRMSIVVSGWGSWSQTNRQKSKSCCSRLPWPLKPVLIFSPLIKIPPTAISSQTKSVFRSSSQLDSRSHVVGLMVYKFHGSQDKVWSTEYS